VTIAPQGRRRHSRHHRHQHADAVSHRHTTGLIPSLNFGSIASAGATPTPVSMAFEQRFLIWQIMDNLTKVHARTCSSSASISRAPPMPATIRPTSRATSTSATNASNALNTGYGFANALLGVYTSYSQANGKPYQNYLYHDVSFYAQDTWKVNRHLTLDLGIRFSWYSRFHNTAGDGATSTPRHTIPPRRRACTGRSAWRLDLLLGRGHLPGRRPGFRPAPRRYRTRSLANYVGKLVPGAGSVTDGWSW